MLLAKKHFTQISSKLTTNTYPRLFQISKMESLATIVNYYCKVLHLRCLLETWIRLFTRCNEFYFFNAKHFNPKLIFDVFNIWLTLIAIQVLLYPTLTRKRLVFVKRSYVSTKMRFPATGLLNFRGQHVLNG